MYNQIDGRRGRKTEISFSKSLEKAGFNYKWSSLDENLNHIDLWVGSQGIDVKGAKRFLRTDEKPSFDKVLLELHGTKKGVKGWATMNARYGPNAFAFELEQEWLIVCAKALYRYIIETIDFKAGTYDPEPIPVLKRIYRRCEYEAITWVDVEDIKKLKNMTITK